MHHFKNQYPSLIALRWKWKPTAPFRFFWLVFLFSNKKFLSTEAEKVNGKWWVNLLQKMLMISENNPGFTFYDIVLYVYTPSDICLFFIIVCPRLHWAQNTVLYHTKKNLVTQWSFLNVLTSHRLWIFVLKIYQTSQYVIK